MYFPKARPMSRPAAVKAMRVVADWYEVTVAELQSGKGSRETYARQVAMYLASELGGLSYVDLGRLFGKHKQTVWGAVKRVRAEMVRSATAKAQVEQMAKEVRSGDGSG